MALVSQLAFQFIRCSKYPPFTSTQALIHMQRTVSRCFATLRQLRGIRSSVPQPVFRSLFTALVLSRLDYCNSVLVGLPAHLISHLQSVQNAAARLIFQIRRSEHITDAFLELHWLRIPERIVYKLAVQTFFFTLVCLSVCVCLSVGLLKKLWTDFD